MKSSKKSVQADGSTRHEFTLSPEVEEKLVRAQALLSHAVPTQDVAEFLEYLCDKVIQQKTSVGNNSNSNSNSKSTATASAGANPRPAAPEVSKTNVETTSNCRSTSVSPPSSNEKSGLKANSTTSSASKSSREGFGSKSTAREAVSLSVSTKKTVMNTQKCCQYRDAKTGRVCGNTWFVQVDHRQPQWAGGSHEINNLQVLCAAHNQQKYRNEAHIRSR